MKPNSGVLERGGMAKLVLPVKLVTHRFQTLTDGDNVQFGVKLCAAALVVVERATLSPSFSGLPEN